MGTKVGEGRVCGSLRHLTIWLQVEEAGEQRYGNWEFQGRKRAGQLRSVLGPHSLTSFSTCSLNAEELAAFQKERAVVLAAQKEADLAAQAEAAKK